MKKIVLGNAEGIVFLDSKDYLVVKEYDEYVDDKYVDDTGGRFNQYNESFKINDLLVRNIYTILYDDICTVLFPDFKYYIYHSSRWSSDIITALRKRNSDIDFDDMKENITNTFSFDMKVEHK